MLRDWDLTFEKRTRNAEEKFASTIRCPLASRFCSVPSGGWGLRIDPGARSLGEERLVHEVSRVSSILFDTARNGNEKNSAAKEGRKPCWCEPAGSRNDNHPSWRPNSLDFESQLLGKLHFVRR